MKQVQLPYGTGYQTISISERHLSGVIFPRASSSVSSPSCLLAAALSDPIGSPPLRSLLRRGMTVAILVDDITRPTPTPQILEALLNELTSSGVRLQDVRVVFGLGTHRRMTETEKDLVLGGVRGMIEEIEPDPRNEATLQLVGVTKRHTPVWINREVVAADLRILTGLICPHSQAGYTGGGKAIIPGVAGIETIVHNHGYAHTNDPKSCLGIADGNPTREDIEEGARMCGPSFMINVVLDWRGTVVAAVAGDMVRAHRSGIRIADSLFKVEVLSPADVAVCAGGHPSDIDLYQSIGLGHAVIRTSSPVLKRGGTVVIVAACPDGVGYADFRELILDSRRPQEMLNVLARKPYDNVGQWAAQGWWQMQAYAEVVLVTTGIDKETVERLGAKYAATAQEGIEYAIRRHGNDCKVIVLPRAGQVIPVLSEPRGVHARSDC